MWFFLSVVMAHATPSDALVEAASSAYGKPVPSVALCVKDTHLEGLEPFQVIGVTQRRAGCTLLGVWAHEAWLEPSQAAPALLADAWTKASPAEKSARIGAWTQEVFLAFDQPLHTPLTGQAQGRNWSVAATYLKRRDATGGSLQMEGSFLFSDTLSLVKSPVAEEGTAFTTRLLLNPYHSKDASVETVRAALHSKGKAFQDCFDAAWEGDLAIDGPVRVQWSIASGKASAVGVVATDEAHPELNRCYASVLRRVAFPESLTGTMVWSFTADRRTARP